MPDVMFRLVVNTPVDTPPERVYLDYYQLSEAPFAITPDPGFLFSAGCHRQVLDNIAYAIDSRMGFVLLTGEVGTGKTTLCRTLLDRLDGRAETVYVINPSVSGQELIAGMLEDLGEAPLPHATKKKVIDRLNRRLLAADTNRPIVVIIDDAQTMTPETLEDLRLLSNLETDKRKLIQVVLSGQPELLAMLARPGLRQLKQRIAVHCRLEPLSRPETGEYISRRLFVAGNSGQVGFSPAATRLIHKTADGIPRLINKICDFALTAGYVGNAPTITPAHVRRALAELDDLDFPAACKVGPTLRYGLPVAALLALVLMAAFFLIQPSGSPALQAPLLTRLGSVDANADPAPASQPTPPVPLDPGPLASAVVPPQVSATAIKTDPIPARAAADTPTEIKAATTQDRAAGPNRPSPAPYALQLGSFRKIAQARRGVARYRQEGVPAHWQAVENGRWFRVVAGRFQGTDQASRYRKDHGLQDALIIRAPWTVRVLPGMPDLSNADILQFISEIGFDGLMQAGRTGDNEIYTGLFGSVEDASATAERINSHDRLLAQVVTR